MNTDFTNLLTDICETRGPKGKRMAEYLYWLLCSIECGEAVLAMKQETQKALNDRDCLEQWEEDK